MPRVRNQSLGGRADQAGLLYAAGNTPATFQRTLMPRATMDQALVTGLSASANHALVTLVQDAIQSTALVLVGEARRRSVDEKRWSRATIAADVAAIGAGIAIQRALRARNREPLRARRRAHRRIHARGDWHRGRVRRRVAGSLSRQRLPDATDPCGGRSRGRGPRSLQHLAGPQARANWTAISRARTPKLPSRNQSHTAWEWRPRSRRSARASASSPTGSLDWSRAALPGNAALWRPVAHAAAFAGLAAGARVLAVKALARIEHVQESAEAAFDFPPPNPLVSGSLESLVPFDTLSRAGRRFVWMAVPTDKISEVMGEPARTNPVRAYVGLESAPSEQERVDLAMRELERTGAFDRSWLMVASPTGTGYVNYAAASILGVPDARRLRDRRDAVLGAPVAALARPRRGGTAAHADAVRGDRGAVCAVSRRRRGRRSCCSARASARGRARTVSSIRERRASIDAGIDYAIWIGTPHFSKWKERVLYDDRPDVDRSLIGVLQRHRRVGRRSSRASANGSAS